MWIRGLPSPWSGKSKKQRCFPVIRSSHLSGAGVWVDPAARARGNAEPAVRAAAAAATRARKPRRGVGADGAKADIGALGLGGSPIEQREQSTVNGGRRKGGKAERRKVDRSLSATFRPSAVPPFPPTAGCTPPLSPAPSRSRSPSPAL